MDEEPMEPTTCWCGELLLVGTYGPPTPGAPHWQVCPSHGAHTRSLWTVEALVTDLERRMARLEAAHEHR